MTKGDAPECFFMPPECAILEEYGAPEAGGRKSVLF